MDDAQVVGRLERRDAGDRGLELVLHLVSADREEAKDLAEVCLAGAVNRQAVCLGAAMRLFVRIDVPFAESAPAARGP